MSLFCHRVILLRGVVLFTLFCFSLNITVSAAMVTTQQTVTPNLSNKLNKPVLDKDVRRAVLEQQLVAYGVQPEQVHLRLNSMTDSEIAFLSSEISELPAGGEVLGIIAFVFLVLLFTDIAGYTDLFPFVKKTARNSPRTQNGGEVIDRRVDRKRKEPVVIEN